LALALGGCSPPVDVGFESPDPQGRTIALARAAEQRSEAAEDLRHMIALLDSADPAQRMLAIRGLERATGQTLGYRHYGGEAERLKAQRRWADWWSERFGRAAEASR
jgi:hypothetical protein